jgi:predicted signal transduction protein with EAL and GGDEF domain
MLRISGKPIFNAGGTFMGYRGAARDVTEVHYLSEELLYPSSHDTLTGLVNRAEFEHRLRRALESTRMRNVLCAAGARKTEHVLCFLGLDQFKIINDILWSYRRRRTATTTWKHANRANQAS